MSKWNFGDVWEAVADELPDAPALTQGSDHPDLGRVGPAGRQRGPVAARRRCRPAGQGGPLPLQLLGVPRGHLRLLQARPGPHQHQLPLRRRRAGLPVGERRHGGGGLPRGLRRPHRGDPGPGARVPELAVGGRRDGACPPGPCPTRWRPPTTPVAAGPERVRAPWGRGPDDIYMLYTGGTTGMPKGVMWRQDDLFARLNGAGFRRYPEDGGPEDVGPSRPSRAGHDPAAGLPADARDRRVHRDGVPERGRAGGHAHLPAVRPGRAARHRRARAGQRPDHRGRRLRQADPGHPGRPARPLGLDQPGRHHLVGGHVERGDQAGTARPPPRHAAGGRLLLVGGPRHGQLGVVGRARPPRPPGSPWGPRCGSSTPTASDVEPGSGETACWPSEVGSRSATTRTRRRRRPPSGPSTASGTRCPATTPRSARTAPSTCSAGARCASTPAGRRSIPRRSRRWSRPSPGVVDAVVVGIPNERFGEEIVAVVELAPAIPPDSVTADMVIDHVKSKLAGYKAPRQGPLRRDHRAVAVGQGRLRPPPGRDGRVGRA